MYIHVRVRNGNVFKCQWNMIHYVAVWGCEMSWLSLHWLFSNKTIIFIHATDSALFTVFLTITLTSTKLKRLLTFDNFTVPSYNCPITVMHRDNVCVTESSDTLVFLFCLFISYCNWQLVVPYPSTDLPILFGVGFKRCKSLSHEVSNQIRRCAFKPIWIFKKNVLQWNALEVQLGFLARGVRTPHNTSLCTITLWFKLTFYITVISLM